MGFLAGKRLLITGVISNRSIAYGIASACKREGAELAFTYQGDRIKDRVTDFAKEFGSSLVFPCDVGSDEQIDALFAELGKHWTASTAWFIRSRLRQRRPWPATFFPLSPGKTSALPTTSVPTALPHWPRQPCP